jgi:hypothetical protein
MADKTRITFTRNVLLPWLVRKLAGPKRYPTEAEQEQLNNQATSAI